MATLIRPSYYSFENSTPPTKSEQKKRKRKKSPRSTEKEKKKRKLRKYPFRKRSSELCHLIYEKNLTSNGPFRRIRVWLNHKKMVFYDCACGRRKAGKVIGFWVRRWPGKCSGSKRYEAEGRGCSEWGGGGGNHEANFA